MYTENEPNKINERIKGHFACDNIKECFPNETQQKREKKQSNKR